MFLDIFGADEDVVDICVAKFQASERCVYIPLEGLGGVAESKWHDDEFIEAERSDNCCFPDVLGSNWDLKICFC